MGDHAEYLLTGTSICESANAKINDKARKVSVLECPLAHPISSA